MWNKALAIVVWTGVLAIAQVPRRDPTPNGSLKSPEVLPDHRVIFRIYSGQHVRTEGC